MRMFTNLLYDICTVFELFKEGESPRDKRKSTDFGAHQRFWDQRYNELSHIIDAEGVYSLEQRRIIFSRYEYFYYMMNSYPVYSTLKSEYIRNYFLKSFGVVFIVLDIYNTYRPENETGFYYHIYNFLQKSYCPCLDYSGTESDEAAVKRYLREYLAELGFNREDFRENGKMYELGKYQGTIRKGYGKRKSLMKQYIKACKNEYKKDYREKKLDKSELDRILNNIDKFYYAFYSLSILLDMQRKVKILDSIAYYLRVLIREGLWVHGLYGYAARYLYDFNIFDTTPYARALLERFHEFESGPKGALTRYIVSLDDKSQEYIESLKDMVFNLSDKKSYDDVYLENIINYFEQLQNARGYVTRCYMLLAVFIYLIRRNKLHKALRFYDESQKYELPFGYLPGAFSVLRIALEIKVNREKIKHGSLFELLDYVKAYQDAFMDLRVVTDPAYNEDEIQYDANNFTLMRVIKMYNSMLANISTKSDIQPPYITGLLDNVERALDKINILIDKERVYDGETLAELITENKILSSRESKENLIGLFTGRHKYTLLQCIEKLGVLVDYVISPADDIKNVMMLYGNNAENKNRRRLIYNALTIICGDDTKNNQSDPR
ncbi:hypothetical protein ACX9IA_004549 [Escherichia coli]|uniref:Uncharacterized protein n=1 Tax=Escherichia coli TaxID=562 RepID=A0AAP6B2K3_ECOLX|nr:hypothetical protein [Escherichia coli]ELE57558.1 hypothetical protein A1UM_01149 [Escherichia coli KTE75]HDQ6542163.1 hypothetical protein [Escherichia coli O146:H28]EEC8144296.1 hypothetical protein [Escherichia coli]EEQ2503394.1 hypothetical protein [Escherichia coli]EEQ4617974.1 hypothetical protein [Escherichia coli]